MILKCLDGVKILGMERESYMESVMSRGSLFNRYLPFILMVFILSMW